MAKLNFLEQWNVVKAYFATSSSATELAALSPRPGCERGQPEHFEEKIAPWLIIVDILGSDQQHAQAAANNTHQMWATGFRVYCAARAATSALADEACLSLVSAVCNDLAAAGGFVDTDRSKLIRAKADRWSWDTGANDSIISIAFVDISGDFYRF